MRNLREVKGASQNSQPYLLAKMSDTLDGLSVAARDGKITITEATDVEAKIDKAQAALEQVRMFIREQAEKE